MPLGPFDRVTYDGTDFTAQKLNEKIERLVRTLISFVGEFYEDPEKEVLKRWKEADAPESPGG